MDDTKLWCDLKTDEERVKFLRSGRAWKTGIIAESMVEDVAKAFEFRMKAQPKDSADFCSCKNNLGAIARPDGLYCDECKKKIRD